MVVKNWMFFELRWCPTYSVFVCLWEQSDGKWVICCNNLQRESIFNFIVWVGTAFPQSVMTLHNRERERGRYLQIIRMSRINLCLTKPKANCKLIQLTKSSTTQKLYAALVRTKSRLAPLRPSICVLFCYQQIVTIILCVGVWATVSSN